MQRGQLEWAGAFVGDATGGLSSSEMEVYEAQGTKYYKDSELN